METAREILREILKGMGCENQHLSFRKTYL